MNRNNVISKDHEKTHLSNNNYNNTKSAFILITELVNSLVK